MPDLPQRTKERIKAQMVKESGELSKAYRMEKGVEKKKQKEVQSGWKRELQTEDVERRFFDPPYADELV